MDLITPDFGLIFWQTAIFLVVLLFLGKFAWGPILRVIQEREGHIDAALAAADEAKELVAQVEARQEALLKAASVEREQVIKEALSTKQAIIAEAKEAAQQVGKEIVDQARMVVEREKAAALVLLKNEVASLSIQMAEKILQRELKEPQAQEALVEQLLQSE